MSSLKKVLVSSVLFWLAILYVIPAFAAETDRIIIEVIDDKGHPSVESVLLENIDELEGADILQPDFIRMISLQESSVAAKSWGTERIGAKKLQMLTTPIEGSVIVAILDTGVDYTHPFLQDRIVEGYDFIDNDTNPMDVHFHGTHVAGIVVDTTPANVKIMPVRVIDEEGKGYDSDIALGIRFAVDNGADVINMSFVGEEFSPYLADAISYALSKNVIIVAASGNESMDTATLYPASEEKIIVVSATDQNDKIAGFSNTGASIDVSAPGVDIISSAPGQRFINLSGTSLAAPFVSGIAVMLKLEDSTRSVQEIERLLKKYVDDRGATGWDPIFGEGIVDVANYDESVIVNIETATATSRGATSANSTEFISFPKKRDVPLDAKWTITFDRQLTDGDIVDIKILRGDKELPITLTSNSEKQETTVTPIKLLLPRTTYRLLLFVEHGVDYEMSFVTVD